MNKETESMSSLDQSSKPRKLKSRQVSSRFLSPSSTSSHDSGIPSPNQALSPIRRKNGSSTTTKTTDTRKHKSLDDPASLRGLWPSSGITSTNPLNEKLDTLADHLENDTLKDLLDRKDHNGYSSLSRQRSCTESSSAKENHRPILGGSMRYAGKFRFPGKSSSSSRKSTSSSSSSTGSSQISAIIVPGRYSVDENALNRRKSDSFIDSLQSELESVSYMSSTANSRRSGLEVSSTTRPRRGTLDRDNITSILSSENSPKLSKFTIKNAIKRANSLTGYGTTTSQWALSPGRSSSPPVSVENKGKPMSFSNLKPPTSPSRTKRVEKLLNLGLDLFKSKKSSSSSSSNLSPVGSGTSENFHQLRLLHNRLIQWRFVNARGDAVNGSVTKQAESNLLYAWNSITKLQYSVVQKKLQLQKEKLEAKLNFILHSQINLLEAWGDMERQHILALSMTQDCLHSVVCRVPLIEGAKADTQSVSIALRHASDLSASIKSMLTSFSPEAEKTVSLISELAEVVAQEKSLLEECLELVSIISTLEIQERSLKCYLIQQQQQQQEEEGDIP